MNYPRRTFIRNAGTAAAAMLAGPTVWAEAAAAKPATTPNGKPAAGPKPRHDPELVFRFVRAGHNNLAAVREMLAADSTLVHAVHDWGGGDWETALGGAAHMGNRELAEFLISAGSRIDAFAAAMLGYRAMIAAMLQTNPNSGKARGPHDLSLMYHAAVSGDVGVAEAIHPTLGGDAKDLNQALSAAARQGHLEMTRWLLANGVTDPNTPDVLKKTPLATAKQKGHTAIVDELRKHGGTETVSSGAR